MDSSEQKPRKGRRSGSSATSINNQGDHATNEDEDTKTAVNIHDVVAQVFPSILEFAIGPYCISFWPWKLHTHARFNRVESSQNERWKTYTMLCSVSRQWRTMAEQAVAKMRLDRIERELSGVWDYFELIYQPHGYDLPETMASMVRPWKTIAGAQLPPEGLLFVRKHCRQNACVEMYYSRSTSNYRPTRMIEGSLWSVIIPPHRIADTGVVRILNHFDDEPSMFVGKAKNGSGYCLQRPGGPWVMLDGDGELPESEVTPAPYGSRRYGRGLLSLATRQGEDLCATFLRKHIAKWAEEM